MKSFSINKEHILVAVAWLFIYACAPLYIWYADVLNGFEFDVGRMYSMWATTTTFMVLYVVHHYALVPIFFMRKRYIAYTIILALCLAAFTIRLISYAPKPFGHKIDIPMPHEMKPPLHDINYRRHKMPPIPNKMLAPPDVACLLIALMMLGLDLGIVAWSNSQKLHRRLLILEQQNLKQELEHLRYQINPHFFMNTLNNIHILVDVNQERAKRAIIELSGLMRHSLYNGSESMTPLKNEIDFLRQYISLMQLRFGNRLSLMTDLPDAPAHDIMIPPLLYATFVENAFKHGISYQRPSFIHISLAVDDESKEIHFRCENSRNEASTTNDGYHGIGLNNVRKRLDLQYAEDYMLNINEEDPERFVVDLILPIKKQS